MAQQQTTSHANTRVHTPLMMTASPRRQVFRFDNVDSNDDVGMDPAVMQAYAYTDMGAEVPSLLPQSSPVSGGRTQQSAKRKADNNDTLERLEQLKRSPMSGRSGDHDHDDDQTPVFNPTGAMNLAALFGSGMFTSTSTTTPCPDTMATSGSGSGSGVLLPDQSNPYMMMYPGWSYGIAQAHNNDSLSTASGSDHHAHSVIDPLYHDDLMFGHGSGFMFPTSRELLSSMSGGLNTSVPTSTTAIGTVGGSGGGGGGSSMNGMGNGVNGNPAEQSPMLTSSSSTRAEQELLDAMISSVSAGPGGFTLSDLDALMWPGIGGTHMNNPPFDS